MKNLKKVLALVLVLATLMGFATVAGAAEYKDADKINADYTEAIKVLDLIETMQGYPNGEFKPTATITREEAAKVIAIFDNKDSDISTYYTSINPFADEKGRWGESYVGYGYRAGIIAGMNATTFAPTSNVTGTQFLKMALVTLGYDQEAEGFVGSSWAVNVLALAKKLGLVDNLADGWKPENDLTREEAAQILLDVLQCETVEYAQEAKTKDFKPVQDTDGNWNFKGKAYLTVAGAVKTGNKLFEDFDLKKTTSTDAFYRPYTKWTLDKDSVEVMDAPKATFTTQFNACDLLAALGVAKNDTKTKVVLEKVYLNGKDTQMGNYTLQHTKSVCDLEDIVYAAQGTLTQVFYMGKNADGDKTYRVCSIDTWLGKVTKVTKTTTARDDHKKGTNNVEIDAYLHNYQTLNENYAMYCSYDCDQLIAGAATTLTFDDPDGLAKDDYVLFTYSFRDDKDFDAGVVTVDVTEGKEGRLNGYKFGTVAENPSETRVDGEYIKDAVHFHLGYDASKSNEFGTYTFFYDAYGNVIGMKEGADTSKYGVLDGAYITYTKGAAALNVEVVDLDAKTTESTAKKMFDAEKFDGLTAADIISEALLNGYVVKDGENRKAFSPAYDHLFKTSTDSNGVYTIEEVEDIRSFGSLLNTSTDVKVVNGKPYVETNNGDVLTLTSKTQILVHKMDGSYVSFTGYKNVDSMIAHYAEYVLDDDNAVEVIYLTNDVYMTDAKVTAYIGKSADRAGIELKEDGELYFILTAYIDGEAKEVYVSQKDMQTYFDAKNGKFTAGFYQLQYTDIDDVTVVKVLKTSNKLDNYMNAAQLVQFFDGETLKIDNNIYSLADKCALFGIYKNKIVEIDSDEIDVADSVYVTLNDDDQVTALYLVLADND